MNAKNKNNKLIARTKPNLTAAPFRGTVEDKLEKLKESLLAQTTDTATPAEVGAALRQAADEAAALVWLTPYPLLLLPALLEEKVRGARRQAGLQARIRQRSSDLLTLAE